MITRDGAQDWVNVHVTVKSQLAGLLLLDNSVAPGAAEPTPLEALRNAGATVETLVAEAKGKGVHLRALGSGWALSDLAVTDGWLLNTKGINGCFEVGNAYFDPAYPAADRPNVLLAQAGISIAELNVYLEVTAPNGNRRALKTAGIGAGQTVAGSVSGNTHGSAVQFGATPDYVVGIHLVSGVGKPWWIERRSKPVMNDAFVTAIGAEAIRDDDVFDAAVVSFGSFGVITALAIETAPIYHLQFPPVRDLTAAELKARLAELAQIGTDVPGAPYHFEFIFNPHDQSLKSMEAPALRVPYQPGQASPQPVWIARNEAGFALGTETAKLLLESPLPASLKAGLQFDLYRTHAILTDVRGSPGQLFTATVFYFEGYTESALGVSINDAFRMVEVSSEVVRRVGQPCISQVRIVHPGKALLGFTNHHPKTAVFEFGLVNNDEFPRFERELTAALKAANIAYTFHWSKNSGLTPAEVVHMYGQDRVNRWLAARSRVFKGDLALARVFDNAHLVRSGLARLG